MVQIISPSPRAMQAGQIGEALGIGVGKHFPDPQQQVQKRLLQESLSKLPENASPRDLLTTIGPQLLTTPGGAQLLSELAPLFQKSAQSNAYLDYLNQNKADGQGATGGLGGAGQAQQPQKTTVEIKPGGEAYSRNPVPPTGPESSFPQRSVRREPVPLMTPDEMNQKRIQLGSMYQSQGIPADPAAIENVINQEQQNRILNNQAIEKENKALDVKKQNQQARIFKRFEEAKPQATPEEKSIFEKFANEARDADNERDQYEYANRKYGQYETAKQAILREGEVPGFIDKFYRQFMGTYKSKENLIKEMQPPVKKLIELGLENEARDLLSTSLGLGMEDTELTMFPPTPEQSKQFMQFPDNKDFKTKPVFAGPGAPSAQKFPRFPGEESELKPDQFVSFKNKVSDVLQKNPGLNLVAFRGVVNQDKHYAWTDYSKAISELINEGQFNPDPIQEQQINVIKSPPIPGLGAMFNEFYKGTK